MKKQESVAKILIKLTEKSEKKKKRIPPNFER